MTDSPQQPRLQIKQDEQQQQQQRRLCDFCSESIALLYCRADSAKLCLSCDRQVHSTNQLFTKHTRSLLCDSCGSTPASILCSTETFVLCQNCDWERHSLSSSTLHERRPLEGFTGCPSVNEFLAIVGFDDVTKKGLLCEEEDLGGSGFGFWGSENDGYSDYLVWETPSIVTLDDLISSNTSDHSFQAMGVPPLPKNRKAACGQYKEEILSQLREMAKSEPNFSDGQEGDIKPFIQFQSPVPEFELQPGDMNAGFERGTEAGTFRWCNDTVDLANQGPSSKLLGSYIEDNCLVPDKDSDIGGSASHTDCGHEGQSQHCDVTDTTQVLPKVAARELTSQERDSAILRYKEKKKTRRYQKHIRYESRKIRAESRTRIKGRFAKMDN